MREEREEIIRHLGAFEEEGMVSEEDLEGIAGEMKDEKAKTEN